MEKFPSALSLVRTLVPSKPVTCLRPNAAVQASRFFISHFPGEILYAVKTNPRPEILDAVFEAGVSRFDVASIAEIDLVAKRFPEATLCYMHPVKSRGDIRRAYFAYGVRVFAFDTADELKKIVAATDGAGDLTLMLRLAVPNYHAEIDLSAKFGADLAVAVDLLLDARRQAERLGVCFHVGSQCMNPSAYGTAINMVKNLILPSGVMLDVVDVGGGFPSLYPDMSPPPLKAYMSEISQALNGLPVGENCEFWAEPGRALVAEAGSTLVRVDARRGDRLYINDGTYGSLFDAGVPGFIFPVRAIRTKGQMKRTFSPYSFYGPTCDGMDFMKGPFMLPEDIGEDDYIEIGQTGAYGCTMRTQFNGFYSDEVAFLTDAPMMTMYGRSRRMPANVYAMPGKAANAK